MTPRPPLDELLSLLGATLATEGITTNAGTAAGDNFIDAGLKGAGDNSFVSMLAVLYPGQPQNVDSKDITAFDNATGRVTLADAYKGVAAIIPAGVPYKIITFRFTPAEVAAIEAKLDHAGHGLAALAAALAEILEDTGTDLEAKLDALYPYHGLVYYGLVTGIFAAPKFQCSGLVGFGNDFFNGYWAYVVWDNGGAGAAPQGEMLQCTGYLTANGDFTVAAFGGGGIAVDDKVLLLHPAIASLINTTYGLSAIKTLVDTVEGKVDLPAVDEAANTKIGEVIGQKADTASETAADTDSLISYLKGLLAITGARAAAAAYATSATGVLVAYAKALVDAGIAVQAAVDDVGPLVGDFDTDLTGVANNHYNGMLMMFIDGNLAGQAHLVNVYLAANGNCAFAANDQWTEAPATTDKFVLLPSPGAYLKKIYDAVAAITPAGPTNDQMDAAIALCAQIADGWDADLATILDNFSAARIGYLDTLNTGVLLGSRTAAFEKLVGVKQIAVETIDIQLAAASYILFTGTEQDVLIDSLVFRCARDCSGDAGFTGISIETDNATEQVFIPQGDGVKANLTEESQLSWTGAILLKATQTISLTIYGGPAAAASVCEVIVNYRAVVSGGYLNPTYGG